MIRPIRSRSAAFVILALTILVLIEMVVLLDRSEQESFRAQTRNILLQQLGTLRARIEGALNSRLSLARGLIALVKVQPDLSREAFVRFARQLIGGRSAIQGVQLAKDGAASYAYPPDGPLAVETARLLTRSDQKAADARAIATGETVVTGPIDLGDGQQALVSRTPIFIPDPSGNGYRCWGLATILIDFDVLLDEVGLHAPDRPLNVAIRGQDGLGTEGDVFFGDPSVFASAPLTADVLLPGGSWEVAALPAGGWPTRPPGQWWRWGAGALFAVTVALLGWTLMRNLARLRAANEALQAEITERKHLEARLQELARVDPLTGVANRRRFFEAADEEISRSRRYGHPLSVLMIDLDHFKRVNDTYGHAVGDEALKAVTRTCVEILRENDVFARIGGEEFVAALPETGLDVAMSVADRLLDAIAHTPLAAGPGGERVTLTVSIGVTALASDDADVDAILNRADAAMYEAKRNGRNQIVAA